MEFEPEPEIKGKKKFFKKFDIFIRSSKKIRA
jgi:hypothetical protein